MSGWPCTCTPPGVIDYPAHPGGGGCPRHDKLCPEPWTERDEQEMERRWPGWRTGRFDGGPLRIDPEHPQFRKAIPDSIRAKRCPHCGGFSPCGCL